MTKQKHLLLLLLCAISSPAFAQGVIYRCSDTDGNVIYSNEKVSKTCEKTNLAQIDKANILNKPVANTNKNSSTNAPVVSTNIDTNVQNNEQFLRDQKRALILQSELTQEKTQLKTVVEMLAKAAKNDTTQIEQLKSMEKTHRRNIASLEKELGVNKASATKPKPNNIPTGLPFSLPKDAADVQLVEIPKAPLKSIQATSPSTVTPAPQASAPEFVPPPVIRQVMQRPLITNKSLKKKVILPSN